MAKPRIPKKDVTLRSLEGTEKVAMAERIETILSHAKYRLTLLGAFAFLLLGLLVCGAQNVQQLNSQGIAYLLLANQYAQGEFALGVTSYWSPLLSWIMALGLKLGWPDLTAARIATGFAGLLFWLGCVAVLFLSRLSIRGFLIGAWLAALAALPWSVNNITPDLLGAALVLIAMAASAHAYATGSRASHVFAGIAWGASYYAQALLLPVVGASVVGIALLVWVSGAYSTSVALRGLWIQGLVAVLVMLPWWGTVSVKEGHPSVGTVWAINHAVVGPNDIDRYHPGLSRLAPPDPGRLAAWENPTLDQYQTWSPFNDDDRRRHQIEILKTSLKASFKIFLDFGGLGVGILALLGCVVLPVRRWREHLTERWRWGLIPVVAGVMAFLPLGVTAIDHRFFYFCFPLMLVAAFGVVEWLPQAYAWKGFPQRFAAGLLALLFAFPLLPRTAVAFEGIPNPGGYAALDLVDRIKVTNLSGPVAGNAFLAGNRTGLYVAALLHEPWYGDKDDVLGTDYLLSGAELIVVDRQHRVNSDMEFNPAFRDLDTILFSDKLQAAQYPLRVYQIIR